MEKKEKEELKERFMNLVVGDKREKITVKDLTATAMMIRSTPPDYSVLLNFIEKELDKAREEGCADGLELEQLLNAEFFEEDYQNPKRLKELMKRYKLKTKE